MASGKQSTLRVPMILLALVNLAILGLHLWPWQEIYFLPDSGTVAFDPIICLAAYVGLVYWIPSGTEEGTRKALRAGAVIGLLAGVALIANVMLGVREGSQPSYLQPLLLGVAIIFCGVAGIRGSRVSGNTGMGALSGLWCAMMAALLGSGAVLAELFLAGSSQDSTDPWKRYQGLAIGNTALQGLVHALNTVTGFLLLGPLAGAIIALIFAYFGQSQKAAAGH
jgi:hypothetical protein